MAEYPTEEYPTEEPTYPTEEPQQEHEGYDEGEYTTEEAAAPETTVPAREVPAGAVTANEVREAREHLARRKAEHGRRVADVMAAHDFHNEGLPSLQALREERVRLSEQIRHHKDEQDSLTLDIEGQEGAMEIYQIAARVQRYEHFAARTQTYVDQQLPSEIDQVVEDDQRNSEEEIAAYIQELQTKREATLKKVSAAQERTAKRGGKKEEPAVVEDDEDTKRTIEHAESNLSDAQTLSEKVKKFRALKTKLSSELVKEKRDSVSTEQQLNARIKNAELANARDARQCKELNSANAALTTNAQLLMSQLNVEHYGIDNAPTAAQMIEDRKQRQATPEPTPTNASERRYDRGNSGASAGSRRPNGETASVSSRASKPPLVAMKPTESQRNRDEAIREDREMQQRRGNDAASHTSSRRQSLSKPPLVASKPTAAQLKRDEAIRQEREEQSVSRSRPRAMSQASSTDARPPTVASKSTESQRHRAVVQAN